MAGVLLFFFLELVQKFNFLIMKQNLHHVKNWNTTMLSPSVFCMNVKFLLVDMQIFYPVNRQISYHIHNFGTCDGNEREERNKEPTTVTMCTYLFQSRRCLFHILVNAPSSSPSISLATRKQRAAT